MAYGTGRPTLMHLLGAHQASSRHGEYRPGGASGAGSCITHILHAERRLVCKPRGVDPGHGCIVGLPSYNPPLNLRPTLSQLCSRWINDGAARPGIRIMPRLARRPPNAATQSLSAPHQPGGRRCTICRAPSFFTERHCSNPAAANVFTCNF